MDHVPSLRSVCGSIVMRSNRTLLRHPKMISRMERVCCSPLQKIRSNGRHDVSRTRLPAGSQAPWLERIARTYVRCRFSSARMNVLLSPETPSASTTSNWNPHCSHSSMISTARCGLVLEISSGFKRVCGLDTVKSNGKVM
jgi:hypothetical protein